MSILLNSRVVSVTLKQNLGSASSDGTELDLSPYLLTLGALSWDVDENLTKLTAGNLTLTCTDDATSTVWTFISTGLSGASGLLPPWIFLTIDGVQRFAGIIKEPPTRTQDSGTLEIGISAVDWSSMLESKRVLDTDQTVLDRAKLFHQYSTTSAGTSITVKSDYNKTLRRGGGRQMACLATTESANFKVGDWVYFYNYSTFTDYNRMYKIEQALTQYVGGLGNQFCLILGNGFWWKELPGDLDNYGQTSTLYKVYSSTSTAADGALPSFTAAETFTIATAGANPKSTIVLNQVDGLQAGDILNKVTNFLSANDPAFSVTVVDVDPTKNTIYLADLLNNDLVNTVTTFTIDPVSLQQSVLQPIVPIISTALGSLATLDTTSYHPATLPTPCFGFITPDSAWNQNTHTEALAGVSDIQTTSTGYEVLGTAGKAWTGLPGTGWDVLSTWTKYIDWTPQRTTAPTYRMPQHSLPGDAPARSTPVRAMTRYAGMAGWDDDPGGGGGGTSGAPQYQYVYDYSNLRYYEFKFTPTTALTCYVWGGSSWSTLGGFSLTGIGTPSQIVPFKDTTSSVGSGYGLLALYPDGTIKTVLANVSYTAGLKTLCKDAVDSVTGRLQVTLIQTTNGVYYTSPSGYGQIYISGGALKTPFVQIIATNTPNVLSVTPLTDTFLYANSCIITLAKVSYKAKVTDERTIDDTYLFRLDPNPAGITKASDATLETPAFIVKNIPRATRAVRSPVSQDIFGFMGGRLFQIATYLPDTVERFTTLNQTCQALVEFVCAMTNSVAMPTPDGKLRLYTRGYKNTAVDVTVDQVSVLESRWNKHMSSCIVIKGADSCVAHATSTTQLSGLTISYQNDDFIRNGSQAQSLANSYLAFFEKPRKEVTQEWFSTAAPAPWESLHPMDVITINGSGGTQWFLTGLSVDLDTCVATVKLLEAV